MTRDKTAEPEGGFEPPASTSRTWRANQAALLPVAVIIGAPSARATRYRRKTLRGPTSSAPVATVRIDQLWRQVSEKLVPLANRPDTVARVVRPVASVIVIESFV